MNRRFISTLSALGMVLIPSSAEPVTDEAKNLGEREIAFPLVGRWFSSLCERGDCPTSATIVTINDEGTYRWVQLRVIPDKAPSGSGDDWRPTGAELASYLTGKIDLKTGRESIDPNRVSPSFVGITWTIRNGKLWRTQDLGTMGSDAVSFTKEK